MTVQLSSRDPEGKPISYHLLDNSTTDHITLSTNGILQWKPTSNINISLKITIRDICGQHKMETISLSLIKCPCPENSWCVPKGQSLYDCKCHTGYTGKHCDININDCVTVNCNSGRCIDGVNTYTCSCLPGFTGKFCDIEINECDSSPCVNGMCSNGIGQYSCRCYPGYTGSMCETDINECGSDPCLNGYCTQTISNGYTCTCQDGFTGYNCETMINYCESSPCVNGVCLPYVGGYQCQCDLYFTGLRCDHDVRTGVWSSWSQYGPCSKVCDFGLQNRTRKCLLPSSCLGVSGETRLCNRFNCKGNDLSLCCKIYKYVV